MSDGRADAVLIAAARAGDEQAYGELYRRHHPHALRFARSLASQPADAEDLVADAFVRVLARLRSGGGPTEAFRPYLFSAIRNTFYDGSRRAQREQPVDEIVHLVPEADGAAERAESRLVSIAFSQLPERWQLVLWHTAVEGEKPAEVARLLGISPNGVAALAYRAREGLRERYLQAHLSSATDSDCRPAVELLAAYLRDRLSRRDAERVRAHLERCDRCRVLFTDLADENSRLGAIVGPLILGGAAAGYLTTAGSAAGSASALPSLFGRLVRSRELQVGAGVGAGAIVVVLVATLAGSPQPPPAGPGPDAIPALNSVPATTGAPAATPSPVVSPSATGAGTRPPGEPATATALAIVVTITGGVTSTGTASASNDGSAPTATHGDSFSGLPGQSVVPAATMKQIAVANGDGSSAACAGLLGTGGELQLTGNECTVTLGSPVTLTLGAAGPATILLRANAIVAECSSHSGSVVAAGSRLQGIQVVSNLLGIETVLADIAPDPPPNTGVTVPGLLSLMLNEQTTSAGTTAVTALRVSALGTLASVEIASVTCGSATG